MFFLAYRVTSGDCLRADRGMFVLGCGIVSASAAAILKLFFGGLRLGALVRDDQYGFHILKGSDGFDSFPSSHAAIAMAMAGAASLLWPKHRFNFMIAAVAVAFSRVRIQRHFLSDMFAGMAFGLCIVVLIQILFDRCGIQLRAPNSNSE